MKRSLAIAAVLALAACNSPSSSPAASVSSAPTAVSSVAASASASASASPASAGPVHWSGKYTASAGDLYYPRSAPNAKDWSDLKWNGSDAAAGLGDGTIALVVDPTSKLVSGTIDGAIGEALVVGAVDGARLTGKITRKAADDRGLTGTLVADVTADAINGEMKLSSPDAQVLRSAKFALAKQSP